MMKPGQKYVLPINGKTMEGRKEAFLRCRPVEEIQTSGLSCGCGDYAIVFDSLMAQRGYQTLLVDSAALSTLSLASRFAGHMVVAVRKGENSDWCLADPTNRKILAASWSSDAQSFRTPGRAYWIGYCGPAAQYPVSDGDSLRAFYTRTLTGVPHDVLNSCLLRLTFAIDSSLQSAGDGYVNPFLSDFLKLQSNVFAQYGVSPQKEVTVRLLCGEDNALSRITQTETGEWAATIGRQSGCSLSLLDYFESAIARQQ